MTERSAVHSTFVIERTYKAAPARVFQAFADPEQKKKWFGGPPDWYSVTTLDFREGGSETSVGGPKGQPAHRFDARYYDIIPNERMVYAYEMKLGEVRISASLSTIELKAVDDGTLLIMTEQGVYLDGYDDAGQREHGSRWLLDNLAKVVES